MKAFEVWTFDGKKYLAATKDGDGVMIMCEDGTLYGLWNDVDDFRKRQRDGQTSDLKLGFAVVSARFVAHEMPDIYKGDA